MDGFGVNQASAREKKINAEVFPSDANRHSPARLAEPSVANVIEDTCNKQKHQDCAAYSD